VETERVALAVNSPGADRKANLQEVITLANQAAAAGADGAWVFGGDGRVMAELPPGRSGLLVTDL
jgi:hypothetical protein